MAETAHRGVLSKCSVDRILNARNSVNFRTTAEAHLAAELTSQLVTDDESVNVKVTGIERHPTFMLTLKATSQASSEANQRIRIKLRNCSQVRLNNLTEISNDALPCNLAARYPRINQHPTELRIEPGAREIAQPICALRIPQARR